MWFLVIHVLDSLTYYVLQMSAYSFAKQKTIRVRVWGFHFAYVKMKTAIRDLTALCADLKPREMIDAHLLPSQRIIRRSFRIDNSFIISQ